ncbi:MAG TPA: hypothetical protein EYP78_01130 [Candidatus Omnitrophica bacterium]|nr:hypothetical protein [Candidatus Omnitrophota bacterium]
MEKVRTQIYLERRQYDKLRSEAFKANVSISELIRKILDRAYFQREVKTSVKKAFNFVGKGHDAKRDVAVHHDDYIAGIRQ